MKPKKTRLVSRRHVLGASLAATMMLSAPGLARESTPRRKTRKPNFLFILADDMGYADLSCYGRRDYKTPALDALAEEGMKFTSAYANSAVCTASRVALITGRYQYRVPIGLEEPLALRNVGLPPMHPTLASLLHAQGYATSLIGKWHMGQLPYYGPQQSGYDEFWGIRTGSVDYFSHKSFGKTDLWDGNTKVEEAGYLTDLLADRTIDTLQHRAADGRPWLISLHFTAPHWPWEGPDDQAESARLEGLNAKNPLAVMDYDGGTQKTYAAMVTRMDYQIARILDKLKNLGMDQDTVVVFTSDNGGERFADVWPFTGRKTELLEGGLRIPAIVRWPNVSKPGTTSDERIMTMDWLPTFVAAAGGAPDPAYPTDGLDIRGVIAGGALPDRTLFWRFKVHGQQAARSGQWKYLKIAGNTFLFDVVADPLERANLKDRYPEKYAELVAAWNTWNQTMLPLDPASQSKGPDGAHTPDRYGINGEDPMERLKGAPRPN